MPETHTIDTWLKRIVNVAVIVLVTVTCFFLWRISMVAIRIEAAITASSEEVRKIGETAAGLASHVDDLQGKLAALTQTVETLPEWSEVREGVGDAILPGGTAASPAQETCTREVNHLLDCIRQSGLQFQHDDDVLSATWLSWKLRGVWRVFEDSVPDAETFVARVAAKQLDGDPYLVLLEDGSTRPLEEWPSEALDEYRKTGG